MAFIEVTVLYDKEEVKEIFNSDYIINVYKSNENENQSRVVYSLAECTENMRIKESYEEMIKILKLCK